MENEGMFNPKRSRIVELQQYCKDGSIISVEVTLAYIRDEAGKAVGIISVTRDISRRKKYEEDLHIMAEIMKLIPVRVFRKDLELNYVWCNEIFARDAGFSNPKEIIGKNDFQMGWRDQAEKYRQDDRLVIESRHPKLLIEEEQTTPDGKKINLLTSKMPLCDSDGQVIGILGSYVNITKLKNAEAEKKSLESRLRHIDRMDSIGVLAGGIAHDFNNLLMGIQGYASLMLLELDSSHRFFGRLKRIESQVKSGSELTSQLLGFARGGKYDVRITNIAELLSESASMFGRTKKDITIHQRFSDSLWNVEVDRGQMGQVFLNLFVNSWQAMPGGGHIYLAAENTILGREKALPESVKPGRYVKISVTDTGTGIDGRIRERIFDPFFTTKGVGRGSGLGLASAYGIIKNHSGMINVYSELGQGTTFRIYLPAFEKAISVEGKLESKIFKGTEKIVVIDDESLVLEVSCKLLDSLGYRVHAFANGHEAVSFLNKEDVDLVILDMIMPGISGRETFEALQKIKKVRVLLSSGHSINGEAEEIMRRGCAGFIQKPYNLEEISRKVREVLDKK